MKVFVTSEGSSYSGSIYGITHVFNSEEKAIEYKENKQSLPENYGLYIKIDILEVE